MKNVTLVLLVVACVVLGDLYFKQAHRAIKAEAGSVELKQQVDDLQSTVDRQEKTSKHLKTKLEATQDEAATKAAEAEQAKAALEASLTNLAVVKASARTNAKPANPLSAMSEMFKNPEMKEMIKTQQKTVLGPMIEKNYAKLFAEMHLTPEQSSALKEMILNKQLSAADAGMSMFTGDNDPAKRKEMMQQVKALSDTADAQIKDYLGADGFTQLQDYEKTMAERMAVTGLKDQLGGGQTALSDDQEQQLVQLMVDGRKNFKFTTDYSDKSKFDGDFTTMFSEDKMSGYFQEMDQLNQQYLNKAQGVLSPDQLTAFEKYLKNQQTMQKAGMQMASKMFAPAKN